MKSILAKIKNSLVAACAIASTALSPLAAPSLITDNTAYLPGEDIITYFAGGPGNPLDWIGIYPDGVTPGSVGSTRWYYVDGTQSGRQGLTEGTVAFPGGLTLAGDWTAHLLLNDGYTIITNTKFAVIDPTAPHVRTDKRFYTVGNNVVVGFTNGPAGAKDWIGIYPVGVTPSSSAQLDWWYYVDGTDRGVTGVAQGSVTFTNFSRTGNFVAYLFENDGYTFLASDPFTVSEPAGNLPRLVTSQPANNATVAPQVLMSINYTNGASIAANSVSLAIDGAIVAHAFTNQNNLATIGYTNQALYAPGSTHTYALTFRDTATPANSYTNQGTFTVVAYQNITLPAALFFENFESTAEGSLPAGWTETNYTVINDATFDLQNLNSASFATWTVVDSARFRNPMLTYDAGTPETDYQRILTVNPSNVVNGVFIPNVAQGKIMFGNSGYRSGGSQVLYLFSPEYNLTGKSNVYLSFHNLWEQNQDSIGAVEYSIDGGTNWLPILYMLDGPDIALDDQGKVDAVATFTNPQGDTATYTDPVSGETKGGTYGAFIGAAITADLAPFIQARGNDNPLESKRVELFRLPRADNQARVKFRFAHAGTDSWYFGFDNFGLYSIAQNTVTVPPMTVAKGNSVTFTATISGPSPSGYQWRFNGTDIPGATSATLTLTNVQSSQAGNYSLRVTGATGTVESNPAALTVVDVRADVTGQWDFENGDLKATLGNDLEFYDDAVRTGTRFGTTTTFGIPNIGGQVARVMEAPELNPMNGYIMKHGAKANGGGSYVNQYTLIMDVLYPAASADKWRALWQTTERNSNDADFYINPADGIGISGVYQGTVGVNTWHRIALAVDLPLVVKFIDGVKVGEQTLGEGRDGRWSLYTVDDATPWALLLADDGGDNALTYVNSVQFRNGRLSDGAIAAMGGATATGIPGAVVLKITSIAASGGNVTLAWSGGSGNFVVEKKAQLTDANWTTVTNTTSLSVTVPRDTQSGFYRVRN